MTITLNNRYSFNVFSDLIGTGTFGDVYKAKDIITDEVIVLKTVGFEKSPNIEKMEVEANLLEHLIHPHIVRGIEHFLMDDFRG